MIVLLIIFSSKINEEILFQTRRRVYNCQEAFWQLVFSGEGTHSFINSLLGSSMSVLALTVVEPVFESSVKLQLFFF